MGAETTISVGADPRVGPAHDVATTRQIDLVDGKQYLDVAISGGNYSGEYVAFTLPAR